ncbi:MAG: hypothetical protein MJZ20_01310 [Bacteroidaceae bacterium]|nr:hypothetical protein [Bacteroidaceae bacterium]
MILSTIIKKIKERNEKAKKKANVSLVNTMHLANSMEEWLDIQKKVKSEEK